MDPDRPLILHLCHRIDGPINGYRLQVEEIMENLRRFRHHPVALFGDNQPLLFSLFRKTFRQLLVQQRPSLVALHGTLLPHHLFAARECKQRNIPVVCTQLAGRPAFLIERPLKSLLYHTVHHLLPFFCDVMLAGSHHSKNSHLYRRPIQVLPPYPQRYPCGRHLSEILSANILGTSFVLADDSVVFLCPARFTKQKNQHRLVKAFLLLCNTHPSIRLILVGPFTDRRYLRNITRLANNSPHRDRVCILESISPPDVQTLYHHSHVAVLTSFNEGFGRVPYEGLLNGLRVVVSNHGGLAEVSRTSPSAILVNPFSVRSIRQGLEASLGLNPPETAPLHTPGHFHRSLDDIYGRLINNFNMQK